LREDQKTSNEKSRPLDAQSVGAVSVGADDDDMELEGDGVEVRASKFVL
jgi:hypothetical protein